MTAEAFLAKVQDETFIAQEVAKYPNLLESLPAKDSGVRYRLEGYLFPATYTIKESTTVESLIDSMLAAMDKNLSSHYAAIKEKNLTVNELLTIASLVEKEGAKTEDRKLIAGIFYNRLNLGMPLQSNMLSFTQKANLVKTSVSLMMQPLIHLLIHHTMYIQK